ncbi:MAG TPA: AAA family ATPase, partial [Roseiflexaceae bacterium]|nr:AAA family ATPase [Roseiflexaceae bacterium]
NSGYLVLPADDMLRNPVSWDALKRAMRSKSIEIEDLGERLGLISTKSLRPQSIPLDMKVILVGSPLIYTLLATYDETFLELFKVRADFDIRVDRTPENQQALIGFMIGFCRQEGLQPLDAGAVAQLLAYTSRLAEDQDKLSSRQGMLIDTIREAHVHAAHDHAEAIGAEHVRQALDARIFRSNMLQQHYQEAIADGTLLIDTNGSQVGLVNGLSVVRVSEYDFGRPSRISASVGPGRGEIVDIEREVALGGPLHSKGVLIVSGYLTHMYARDKPLSLNARLVFEQSYAGVEGDSASSAELYAVLSALANVPITQGIAVTGSVDQHGHIQAIGGVNEKIEGFFDVCKARGLTGAQGVLIPHSNRRHLMLRDDVVAAVRTGQFHIWAITAIDEGLELLTGIPAGTRALDGSFPAGSVHARVDQRLRSFTTSLRELGAPPNVLLHNGAAHQ